MPALVNIHLYKAAVSLLFFPIRLCAFPPRRAAKISRARSTLTLAPPKFRVRALRPRLFFPILVRALRPRLHLRLRPRLRLRLRRLHLRLFLEL